MRHSNATCNTDRYGVVMCSCAAGFEGDGLIFTEITTTTTSPALITTTVDVCEVCHQNVTRSIESFDMVICECSEGFAGNAVNCHEIPTTTITTTTSSTSTSMTTYTTTTTTVTITTTLVTTTTTVDRCDICHESATCTIDSYGMIICECAESFEENGINCREDY